MKNPVHILTLQKKLLINKKKYNYFYTLIKMATFLRI